MKKLLFLVGFLVIIAFPIKVSAYYCTGEAYDLAEKDAYGVKITHELKFRDDRWDDPYYEVTISNMTKNIQVVYAGSIYKYGMDKDHPDSYVVFDEFGIDSGATFSVFPIEGSPCMGYQVHTVTHSLPYYNIFINSDECATYPKFPLCAKDYRGDATVADFLVELEKYIAELDEKTDSGTENDNTNIFEDIINFYMNNKIITIPLTIVLLSCIVILAKRHMQKNKKRAKYRNKI